ASLGNGTIVAGSPETTMRTALEVRHETGRAMPLLDEGGRLVGVIGAKELLAALVHRGAGAAPPKEETASADEPPPPER
ncbi:MAG: CBS domain-containing protein, partial [Rhodospirillales bacterium]|nr:CBS domain-containing protein [Rhodospirillales bacterium]